MRTFEMTDAVAGLTFSVDAEAVKVDPAGTGATADEIADAVVAIVAVTEHVEYDMIGRFPVGSVVRFTDDTGRPVYARVVADHGGSLLDASRLTGPDPESAPTGDRILLPACAELTIVGGCE